MLNLKSPIILLTLFITCLCLSSCGLFETEETRVKKSYYNFIASIEAKNYEQIWNLTAYDTQKQFENFIYKPFMDRVKMVPQQVKNQKLSSFGVTPAEFEKMTPKDFFIFQLQKTKLMDDIAYSFPSGRTVEKIDINGTQAMIHLSKAAPDKKISNTIPMKLEDGTWRIVLFPPGDIKR